MNIYEMNNWTKKHDLLLNRIAMVNQIHGCDYGWCCGAPCIVTYSKGWYVCDYFGMRLCAWASYDVPSLDAAFSKVDSLADSLWLIRRAGCLRPV